MISVFEKTGLTGDSVTTECMRTLRTDSLRPCRLPGGADSTAPAHGQHLRRQPTSNAPSWLHRWTMLQISSLYWFSATILILSPTPFGLVTALWSVTELCIWPTEYRPRNLILLRNQVLQGGTLGRTPTFANTLAPLWRKRAYKLDWNGANQLRGITVWKTGTTFIMP